MLNQTAEDCLAKRARNAKRIFDNIRKLAAAGTSDELLNQIATKLVHWEEYGNWRMGGEYMKRGFDEACKIVKLLNQAGVPFAEWTFRRNIEAMLLRIYRRAQAVEHHKQYDNMVGFVPSSEARQLMYDVGLDPNLFRRQGIYSVICQGDLVEWAIEGPDRRGMDFLERLVESLDDEAKTQPQALWALSHLSPEDRATNRETAAQMKPRRMYRFIAGASAVPHDRCIEGSPDFGVPIQYEEARYLRWDDEKEEHVFQVTMPDGATHVVSMYITCGLEQTCVEISEDDDSLPPALELLA